LAALQVNWRPVSGRSEHRQQGSFSLASLHLYRVSIWKFEFRHIIEQRERERETGRYDGETEPIWLDLRLWR